MQILNKHFLYTLLAIFISSFVVAAVVPTSVWATDHDDQDNSPCYIDLTQHPSETDPGERNPYTLTGKCDASMYAYYGIVDITDSDSWNVPGSPGEKWILGPKDQDTPNVGSYIGETVYHDYGDGQWDVCEGKSGQVTRTIEARVNYNGRVDVETEPLADYDRDTVVVNCGSDPCSIWDLWISGPNYVEIPAGGSKIETYDAGWSYDGGFVEYQFYVENDQTFSKRTTSSGGGDQNISWDSEGTYRVCVDAQARSSSRPDSDTKTACMNVEVVEIPDSGGYSASFSGQDVPTCVAPGESFDASVTMQNPTNNRDWTPASAFKLGSRNPTNNTIWGTSRVPLQSSVSAGESYTFNFSANAPSTEGTYDFKWQMIGDDPGWFGGTTPNVSIAVDNNCSSEVIYGCTDENAENYDPDATRDDGSCIPPEEDFCDLYPNDPSCTSGPGETAKLTVSSEGINGARIKHLREDKIGPGGKTYYERTFTEPVPDPPEGKWWWLTAKDYPGSNLYPVNWRGCDRTGGNGASCGLSRGIDLGETRNLTVVYGNSPVNKVTIIVDSVGLNAPVSFLRWDWKLGLEKERYRANTDDFPIYIDNDVDDPGWMTVPNKPGTSNMVPYKWDGPCIQKRSDNRGCRLPDLSRGNTYSFTVYYKEDVSPPPIINNFSLNDPELDINANPPKLHVDDQPFTLVWSTENADSVTGQSNESNKWPGGSLNNSDTKDIDEGSISGESETFEYILTAHKDGFDNVSDSVAVTLIDPPRFNLSAEPTTNIDGAPGSKATNQITVTSHKYDGDVLLEVKESDIPDSLKDDEGPKIQFDFVPPSVDTSGNTSVSRTLDIEILRPIYENISATITVTGTDEDGNADPSIQTDEFILNIDGFNPRTIEEF